MSTHITNPRQLRLYGAVLAMAALLAVLLAVTLTAGPTMAQTIGGPVDPRTGDNEDFYDEPYPCSEEAQPDENTVSVIRQGYYALFDTFWDYEVGHLSDNFCPPAVTVTTEDDGFGETTTKISRTDANIHISETAFSVPDSYKATVIDSSNPLATPGATGGPTVTGATIDLVDYPFLRQAVSAVGPDPDSEAASPPIVFLHTPVWWVRLDEPDTPDDETSPLKIAFSAALMKDGDWFRDDDGDGNTDGDPVQFLYSAVHVLEAGVPQEVHVVGADFFAFEERATNTPMDKAKWSNLDTAAESEINLAIGEYKPMQFLFTKPGEYLVQAHMQAYVRKTAPTGAPVTWTPINSGATLTSPTEWYTFHVGPVADLGVTLTHTDETSDAGTTVTDGTASFSVTAANNGPGTAEGVVVEVNLPVGLSVPATATLPEGVTYECGVLSWQVGNLASGASETESLTATVDDAGPKSLTVDAEIHSSTVDDDKGNNTASVVALTDSTVVTPPFFMGVERSIVEHAATGTHVGEPVAAKNPDGRALDYWLTGRCAGWFDVHDRTGQIIFVGVDLDYDDQTRFDLRIHVSDGLDANGNTETAKTADHWIPLTINVLDTPDDAVHPTVSLTADPDFQRQTESIRITAKVANLTVDDGDPYHCLWEDQDGNVLADITMVRPTDCHIDVVSNVPDIRTYKVHIKWPTGGMTASTEVTWYQG